MTRGGDEVTAGHLFGPVRVSPTLCRRLDALAAIPHVVPLWLTSWAPESRRRMDPFPGRDWATLALPEDVPDPGTADAVVDPDRLGWWKWNALRTWLEAHREIRALVWCDDDLAQSLWAEEVDPEEASPDEAGPRASVFALEPDDAPFVTTTATLIATRLAAMGVTGTLIAPTTAVGLTRADIHRVEAAVAAAQRG